MSLVRLLYCTVSTTCDPVMLLLSLTNSQGFYKTATLQPVRVLPLYVCPPRLFILFAHGSVTCLSLSLAELFVHVIVEHVQGHAISILDNTHYVLNLLFVASVA